VTPSLRRTLLAAMTAHLEGRRGKRQSGFERVDDVKGVGMIVVLAIDATLGTFRPV
jgi:hypothetical protein